MSGSATYYINESMSESSGDSLNNSNSGSNNAARALQQLRNTRNNIERDNGLKLKGSINWILIHNLKALIYLLYTYKVVSWLN
jgi:hypothetical protein